MMKKAIGLLAWHSNGSNKPFELLPNQSVLVGKSSNCGLQLVGDDISDIHCRLGFEDGQLWVQDWLSMAGTKVNGELLSAKTQVIEGSVIEVGGYKIQIAASEETRTVAEVRKQDAQKSQAHASDEELHLLPDAMPLRKPENVAESSNLAHSGTEAKASQVSQEKESRGKQVKEFRPVEYSPQYQKKTKLDSGVELFSDHEEVYERETVELLLAEIEDLRTTLALRDADVANAIQIPTQTCSDTQEPDGVLHRIQELVEEANRADERVLILEEMLHAAEDANRAEIEERAHLEAWVGDIEKRVGQREQEHAAELEVVRERLDSAGEKYSRLQCQLQQAATTGDSAQQHYETTMENLQQENRQLQDSLEATAKDLRQLKQKYENQSEQTEVALREDRAKIAKEHAEMSRLKFEYARKIRELEEVEIAAKIVSETDPRLESLREHRQFLREMSEEKKEREKHSLTGRLKRIWNLVE